MGRLRGSAWLTTCSKFLCGLGLPLSLNPKAVGLDRYDWSAGYRHSLPDIALHCFARDALGFLVQRSARFRMNSGAKVPGSIQAAFWTYVLKLLGVATEDPGNSLCCVSSELAVCNPWIIAARSR